MAEQEISDTEIKLFKTTLLARRFPGIRDLKDADIRALIAADRKAQGRVMEDPRNQRTFPKTQYYLPPKKRETGMPAKTQDPFSPINPTMAKESIRRPYSECHLGEGNQYDGDTTSYLTDKHSDDTKRAPTPFMPTCPAQAKSSIMVNVYLYSADAQNQAAEKESIRSKAHSSSQQLHELSKARRGQTLV